MRIAVFGAGAIGSLVGALLSARHEVTLVGREAHVNAIREVGLKVTGQTNLISHPRACTGTENMDRQDMVIITVKAYDTQEALEGIKPLVGEHTTVVSLQNGLGNAELLGSEYDGGVIGLTSWGATMIAPGVVRLAGKGDTMFGSLTAPEKAISVTTLFGEAGIPSRLSEDILGEVWMKAIVNACINPVTALLRRTNGVIEKDPELIRLVGSVCREGTLAASANGILLPDNPLKRTMEVVKHTRDNRSSMLQDIEQGRRTEIDQISGALVMKGEERKVTMPVNRTLWQLVMGLGCRLRTAPIGPERWHQKVNNNSP